MNLIWLGNVGNPEIQAFRNYWRNEVEGLGQIGRVEDQSDERHDQIGGRHPAGRQALRRGESVKLVGVTCDDEGGADVTQLFGQRLHDIEYPTLAGLPEENAGHGEAVRGQCGAE